MSAPAATAATAAASTVKPPDPDMDHLTSATYEHVYEPCEDSYLLMDALYEDLHKNGMRTQLDTNWPTCMEVGQTNEQQKRKHMNELCTLRSFLLGVLF